MVPELNLSALNAINGVSSKIDVVLAEDMIFIRGTLGLYLNHDPAKCRRGSAKFRGGPAMLRGGPAKFRGGPAMLRGGPASNKRQKSYG